MFNLKLLDVLLILIVMLLFIICVYNMVIVLYCVGLILFGMIELSGLFFGIESLLMLLWGFEVN